MPASHSEVPKPSALLALLSLALVHRLRPSWTAVALRDAAAAEGVSPERLSRLASRALAPFEAALVALTRRGRPTADVTARRDKEEHALAAELLGVAGALLAQGPRRLAADARAHVLGALTRLQAAHSRLTLKRFAATLAIPERTLRAWRAAPPTPPPAAPSAPPAPPPRRSRRRGRFAFDLLIPGAQLAADTTDLCLFGVPLKLLAMQDVGGRDQDLLDDVILDDHENAELVVKLFAARLAELPGAQLLTDQGTPYMARETAAALDALAIEHAPQPEGAPTRKATIERAFGTVKSIAAVLFAATDGLAVALPALHNPELAKAVGRVVITALLRAYQAGARATRRALGERGGVDPEALARAAAHSRDQARARDDSVRLLLEHIHAAYEIDMPLERFRRALRGYPLDVLRGAERDFARQVHRGDIQKRAAYFAAIVRAHDRDYRGRRAREYQSEQRRERADADQRDHQHRHTHWHEHPAEWLGHALETLAAFWLPEHGELVAGGAGPGTAYVRGALGRLAELHGAVVAADIAATVADSFARIWRSRIGDGGVNAVLTVVRRAGPATSNLDTTDPATPSWARLFAAATLRRTGPPRCPAPPEGLRN
jgi:hypothetical protein